MTYRAYLQTFDGQVSEKTITKDPAAALAAFSALVNRTDLDGQKLAVALTCNNSQVAFHRFDRVAGDADYWRDKLDEIEISAAGRGRPDTMDGGRRVQVYLDAPSLATADRMGDGNMSAGIRAALASAGDLDALRQAARLALTAIDSRISTEPGPARDEDREAYEALCRVLAD